VISAVGQRTITFQLERKGKVREEVVGVDDKTKIEKGGASVKLRDLQERVLSFIGQRGEAFYANQSVNGLLNRLVGNGPVLEWQRDQFAPYDPVVRWLTLLLAVLLMLVALWYRRVVRSSMPECDAAAFLIAVTAGAPIAWEHHYGVLLPIAALATGPAIATDRHATRTGLLIVAVLISGQYLTVTHATASTPWSIAMSYTLAAALLLLGVLLSLPPNPPDISASSRDR
jgi:hypothetical protein